MATIFTCTLSNANGSGQPAVQLWLPSGSGRLVDVLAITSDSLARGLRKAVAALAIEGPPPVNVDFGSGAVAKAELRYEFFPSLPDIGPLVAPNISADDQLVVTLIPGTGLVLTNPNFTGSLEDIYFRWTERLR